MIARASKTKIFLLILHYKTLRFTNEHLEKNEKKNKRTKLAQLMQMFLKELVKAETRLCPLTSC